MRIFSRIYQLMLAWSKSRQAPYFLAGVSFAEASFFPIPPDIMLISMGLVRPKAIWVFAAITTIFSVLGGILGYTLGAYGIELLLPLLKSAGYYESYLKVQSYFQYYGIWFVFVAGFTPIPYKLFTIAAGGLHMALLPFVVGSIIGRGMRFFLVATLMYYKGESIEKQLSKHVELLSWLIVLVLIIIYGIIKLWP